MIAIGICLLAAGHVSRPGSEAMTELDEIRAESTNPRPKTRTHGSRTRQRIQQHPTRARGGPLQLRRGSAHPDRLRSRGLQRRS